MSLLLPPLLLLSAAMVPSRDSHSSWLEQRDWPKVARFWARQSANPEGFHRRWAEHDDDDDDDRWIDGRVSAALSRPDEEAFRWSDGEVRGREKDRATYFVTLGYDGSCFSGWQQQRRQHGGEQQEEEEEPTTVGGVVRDALENLLAGRNGGKPLGQLTVAGRTDRGVSALAQVCSFHTWEHTAKARRQHQQQKRAREGGEKPMGNDTSTAGDGRVVTAQAVRSAVAEQCAARGLPPGAVSVHRLRRVPRRLHPRFSARWRRYAFLLPLNEVPSPPLSPSSSPSRPVRYDVCPEAMDESLRALEGLPLRYNALAFGKLGGAGEDSDRCTLIRARARLVHLPCDDGHDEDHDEGRTNGGEGSPAAEFEEGASLVLGRPPSSSSSSSSPHPPPPSQGSPAILVELVGDRFLRRMVRVLVATAARIACTSPTATATSPATSTAGSSAMRAIISAEDRSAAAHPAPACGLAFVGVGYANDDELLVGTMVET